MFKKFLGLIIVSAFIFLSVHAQNPLDRKNEVGLSFGAFIYQGDLSYSDLGTIGDAKPMVRLYYSRLFTPHFSARLNVAGGFLAGNDHTPPTKEYRIARGFSFSTPLVEISGVGVWNILGNNYPRDYNRFSPYLFGGFGVAFANITRSVNNMDTALHGSPVFIANLARDLATPAPRVMPVIPVGLGLKYDLTPRIGLIAEGNFRIGFTDYLDGFSYSANPTLKDAFYSLSIGATFNFGGKGSGNGFGGGFGGRRGIGCPSVQ